MLIEEQEKKNGRRSYNEVMLLIVYQSVFTRIA